MKASQTGYNPVYSEDAPTVDQLSEIEGYAVLEFGAPWCEHCMAVSPLIEEALTGSELPHIKIFDGKGEVLGRSFKVKIWPTLILLKAGEEVDRIIRPADVPEVDDLLGQMQN